MGIVANIMVIARVSGFWQEIILGIILIFAVWLDLYVQKRSLNQNFFRSVWQKKDKPKNNKPALVK
jgi:ribose transport system permease protein